MKNFPGAKPPDSHFLLACFPFQPPPPYEFRSDGLPLPSSCYNNANLPVEVVSLRTAEKIFENGDQRIETEEEIAVRVESSSDIEENDSLDEYDSDETEDEEVIPDVNEDQNKYDDGAQVAEEAFCLVGSRSRFGRAIRFNGNFLTKKGAGLFQIQVVHLCYCSWENIAIKFIFQKYTYYKSFQDSCLYFSRYNILVRQNEHQFFGYDVLR